MSGKQRGVDRVTTGYAGGLSTIKERQWYAALSDKVGHKAAFDYADHIINWRQGRPPPNILASWLHQYDDGKWSVDDAIRTRVENKVDRFHKHEHMTFLRRMIRAGGKALEPVEETGDMKQPVIIKYLADGVNQGMLMHNTRNQQAETLSLGGLTINVGQKPPQRKLRQKEVDKIIDGEFKVLPEKAESNA